MSTASICELLIERRLKRLDGVRLQLAVDAGPEMLKDLPGALLRAMREAHR